MNLTRRQLMLQSAAVVALPVPKTVDVPDFTQTAASPTGPFTPPPLPYPADALEPHIDAQTMTIHHDRHHAASTRSSTSWIGAMARRTRLSALSSARLCRLCGWQQKSSAPSAAKSARAARARLRATNNRHRSARRIRASVRCIIAPAAAIDFALPGFLS